jgi:hypothetical protein
VSPVRLAGRSLLEILARIGYLAKGLIFFAVGVLALMAAFGFAEGQVTGTDGAIHVLGRGAPGRWGFGLLAVGLSAHVFWRLYQAFVDPAEKGLGWKALVQRGGFLVSAGFYSSMVVVTLSAVTGLIGSDQDSESLVSNALGWPGGRWLIGLIGLVVIGVAAYQAWRAWSQPYRDKWMGDGRTGPIHPILAWIASYGIVVRAIIFLVLGWHLLRAGWFVSSDEVIDVATWLWQLMSRENFGGLLLGLVASGLICYGLYCLFNAGLRRIDR